MPTTMMMTALATAPSSPEKEDADLAEHGRAFGEQRLGRRQAAEYFLENAVTLQLILQTLDRCRNGLEQLAALFGDERRQQPADAPRG
jgi:hypothetical protein